MSIGKARRAASAEPLDGPYAFQNSAEPSSLDRSQYVTLYRGLITARALRAAARIVAWSKA